MGFCGESVRPLDSFLFVEVEDQDQCLCVQLAVLSALFLERFDNKICQAEISSYLIQE